MRTTIEIDDALIAEAQKASGEPTKKRTVEAALKLLIKLRRQQEVGSAFGKYRWCGTLGRSRTGVTSSDGFEWRNASSRAPAGVKPRG